jgi:hypothetical protein
LNFLSHYYLDRDNPSAYFKLGLLLPDLIKGFNQRMRKNVSAYHPRSEEHIAISQGIAKHHLADKIFHSLQAFELLQANFKSELKSLQLLEALPRSWFLAHIAVEMMIDRHLLKLYPHLCVEYYNTLATVSQPLVEKYFTETGCNPLYSDFFGNFKVFTERRFLQYYPSDDHFTEALLGAWYRATGNKVDAEVRQRTQEAILKFERQNADLLQAIPQIVVQELKTAT